MIENSIPYCDLHYAPMRYYWALPRTFCGCTKDRYCKRRYDAAVGYFAYGPSHTRHLCRPLHYSPYLCVRTILAITYDSMVVPCKDASI